MVRETKSRIRAGTKMGENFWRVRGLRQRCSLSPLLFNVLTAVVEEEMGKVRWGGVRIGKRRQYADNMVLVAEGEDEMRSIVKR